MAACGQTRRATSTPPALYTHNPTVTVFPNSGLADDQEVTGLYAIRRGERPLIRAVGRVSHWTPEWSNSRSR